MNLINKNIIIKIFFIIIAIIGVTNIYKNNKIMATLNFTMEVNNSSTSKLQGQIFYALNNHFYPQKNIPFAIENELYNTNKTFYLDIKESKINAFRFDPLIAKGIVKIYNVSLDTANKVIKINLSNIKEDNSHNIKILKQTKNYIYLESTGSDPHFILIQQNKPLVKDKLLLKSWVYIIFYSIIYILVLYLIYKGLTKNIITFESLIIVSIITIYTIFTLLFSKVYMAMPLINLLVILSVIVIIKKGIKRYIKPLCYIILFVITIGILSYISDIANGSNKFNSFMAFIPVIIKLFLIPIAMLYKSHIEYKFYKNYLFFLLLAFSFISTLLHFNIPSIDTSFIYGYQMSMSGATQKIYTFWLLFLMWGSITILLNKKTQNNFKYLLIIFIFSAISIFTGYSQSAMIAYILSFLVFIILSFINKDIIIKYTPILISLYLISSPLIFKLLISSDYFYYHSHGRGVIYEIALSLINKKFWFGYGFHSSMNLLNMNIDFNQNLRHILQISYFAHSIPLWLWLNFGFIGISILSTLLYISLKKLLNNFNSYNQLPSIIALIVSFIIVTSLSWSGWSSIVFLTYAFFVSMIILTLQNNKN